jgi:2-oxoglutarate ferredoxin oxidoreductase subunit alpha
MDTIPKARTPNVEAREKVVILFAGDSGDGIQLTGSQFTDSNALFGNDVSTFPNYPAEIRAPQGTTAGVSGFQLHFGSVDDVHPGRSCDDTLVVMNAAALKVNLHKLKKGGIIIANSDGFDGKNLRLAGYIDEKNPLTDGSLDNYALHTRGRDQADPQRAGGHHPGHEGEGPQQEHVRARLHPLDVQPEESRSPEKFLEAKFGKAKPELLEANRKVVRAGYNYGDTSEIFTTRFAVKPAPMPKGTYRNITGNQGVAHRPDRRRPEGRAGAVLRQLPHHPGQRHPARAFSATRTSG